MFVNVTDRSKESLQAQLIRQVRTLILRGDLRADQQLPSIRQLASEQRVSVVTVQRAYEELEELGLLYVRRSKGYFVCPLDDNERLAYAAALLKNQLVPIFQQTLAEGMTMPRLRLIVNQAMEAVNDE